MPNVGPASEDVIRLHDGKHSALHYHCRHEEKLKYANGKDPGYLASAKALVQIPGKRLISYGKYPLFKSIACFPSDLPAESKCVTVHAKCVPPSWLERERNESARLWPAFSEIGSKNGK